MHYLTAALCGFAGGILGACLFLWLAFRYIVRETDASLDASDNNP